MWTKLDLIVRAHVVNLVVKKALREPDSIPVYGPRFSISSAVSEIVTGSYSRRTGGQIVAVKCSGLFVQSHVVVLVPLALRFCICSILHNRICFHSHGREVLKQSSIASRSDLSDIFCSNQRLRWLCSWEQGSEVGNVAET